MEHAAMHYVYIIGSLSSPGHRYVGFTACKVDLRLERHNAGTTPSTARYRPWQLLWVGAFTTKELALAFETYLKSGSGRAFANKHLLPMSGLPSSTEEDPQPPSTSTLPDASRPFPP